MVKEKTCNICGQKFTPYSSLQKCCRNYKCMVKHLKIEKKEKHEKLKEIVKDYKKLAWTQISRYVRYTSSIKDDQGRVQCYTCPKILLPSEADCGHFKHDKLDGDLRNLRIQCSKCNRYLSGNLSEYRKNLVRDHGEEWVQQLERDSSECEPLK